MVARVHKKPNLPIPPIMGHPVGKRTQPLMEDLAKFVVFQTLGQLNELSLRSWEGFREGQREIKDRQDVTHKVVARRLAEERSAHHTRGFSVTNFGDPGMLPLASPV